MMFMGKTCNKSNTLSLHDALPISTVCRFLPDAPDRSSSPWRCRAPRGSSRRARTDRKSTRLNSSHLVISYAVFCLKKKIRLTPRSIADLMGFEDILLTKDHEDVTQ